MPRPSAIAPDQFTNFGDLLKYLRRRAGLTQQELAIGVGYSVSQISRLEKNRRVPDTAAIAARFVPELDLEGEPLWVERLLDLAAACHNEPGETNQAIDAQKIETPPHNLPLQLTGFVGRENEIAEITRLLIPHSSTTQNVRLLTLTGMGGSGKTRLALEAAAALLSEFPGGVWFVNLAPIRDSQLVVQTVVQTLGLRLPGNQTPLDRLKEHLRGKVILLILDNYEQVSDAASWLTELLLAMPTLKLLVTSRVPLHLYGEREFLVPPLSIPHPETRSVQVLAENEAAALFVQRAQSVQRDFQLTPENVTAVAEICVRLDGLPLAIELAAARVRVLSPNELLARSSSRLSLLTGGARDLPARLQTLRNTIDWSYDLLNPEEQRLFARLGVFVGGWVLNAAERVCNAEGDLPGDMVDRLDSLLDHNLIQKNVTNNGAARFGMLETLREYALQRLAASGELEMLRQYHAECYLAYIESVLPKTFGTAPTGSAVTRILEEQDNLRAALEWSLVTKGNAQTGLRIAEAVSPLFIIRAERRAWLERALAHADAEGGYDPATRARVIRYLGEIQALLGDYAGGEKRFLEALVVFQQLGDRAWIVASMERWGWVARERGEASTADARLERALELARELNNYHLIVAVTNSLAETMTMRGETVVARQLLEGILPGERDSKDSVALSWTLNHLGHVAQAEGDYTRATTLYLESLSLFREYNGMTGIIETLYSLGETALAQGDATHARLHLSETLALTQKSFLPLCITWCLAGLAGVAMLNEEPERSALLWGAAESLRQRLGGREGPATHDVHEQIKMRVRRQLGEAAFAQAEAKGRRLTMEEAIAAALYNLTEGHRPPESLLFSESR